MRGDRAARRGHPAADARRRRGCGIPRRRRAARPDRGGAVRPERRQIGRGRGHRRRQGRAAGDRRMGVRRRRDPLVTGTVGDSVHFDVAVRVQPSDVDRRRRARRRRGGRAVGHGAGRSRGDRAVLAVSASRGLRGAARASRASWPSPPICAADWSAPPSGLPPPGAGLVPGLAVGDTSAVHAGARRGDEGVLALAPHRGVGSELRDRGRASPSGRWPRSAARGGRGWPAVSSRWSASCCS